MNTTTPQSNPSRSRPFRLAAKTSILTAALLWFAGWNTASAASTPLFSVLGSACPDSGNWPTVVPSGGSLARIGAPTTLTINSQKWEWNHRVTSNDGWRFARYAAPLPVNGVSIVAAVRPIYCDISGELRGEIVDIFYDRLALAISHTDGRIMVARGGWNDWGPAIPNGQITVLSLVVKPDGSYQVWANGTSVMTGGTSSNPVDFSTSINPDHTAQWGNDPDFTHYIDVGRNDPDGWSSFNGNIGDVLVYTEAIDTATRTGLESGMMSKYGTATTYTINASTGSNGTISPLGLGISAPQNTDWNFLFLADPGYMPDQVTIDGGAPVAATSGSYSFANVTANHSIQVTFKPRTAARKIVDLKPNAGWTDGSSLAGWPNAGTLGGQFAADGGKDTVAPVVAASYLGKQAVVFNNKKMLLSSNATTADGSLIKAPWYINQNGAYTVFAEIASVDALPSWQIYLDTTGNSGGNNTANFRYDTDTGAGAVDHWEWTSMSWGGSTPSNGAWHYVAITFDGTVEKVYKDGILVNTETKHLALHDNGPISLGARSSDNVNGWGREGAFKGALASLEIWDDALSAATIATKAGVHQIQGKVTIPDGTTPINGATVTAVGASTFTGMSGTDGTYSVPAIAGTYTVTASFGVDSSAPRSVTIGSSNVTDVNLTIAPSGNMAMFPNSPFVGTYGTGDIWNLGTKFTTGSKTVYVTKLGYWDYNRDGLAASHDVAIFDAAGNALVTVTVPGGTGAPLIGDWRYVTLSLPLALAPGTTYTLAGNVYGDEWFEADNRALNSPVFDGYASLGAFATASATLVCPPLGGGFQWHGAPDVTYNCNLIATTVNVTGPYSTWLGQYTFATGADKTPTGDPDGDGMTNQQEFAFGLDPTSGKSCNPITTPFAKTTGKFRYTRTAASGLTYTVWTSTNLKDWTEDLAATASQADKGTVGGVQTVEVTITNPSPVGGKLFLRVKAE